MKNERGKNAWVMHTMTVWKRKQYALDSLLTFTSLLRAIIFTIVLFSWHRKRVGERQRIIAAGHLVDGLSRSVHLWIGVWDKVSQWKLESFGSSIFFRVIAVSCDFYPAPAGQNQFNFQQKTFTSFFETNKRPERIQDETRAHGKYDFATQTRLVWTDSAAVVCPINNNGGHSTARFSIYFCADATHKFHLSLATAFKTCSVVWSCHLNTFEPWSKRSIDMRSPSLRQTA